MSIAFAGFACNNALTMSPSNSALRASVDWDVINAIPAELAIAQFLVLNSFANGKSLWLRISSFLQTPSPISIESVWLFGYKMPITATSYRKTLRVSDQTG